MKKYSKRILAAIVSITLVVSVPIASRVVSTQVKAADEYQLVWSDEFNGNSLDRNNWNIEVNGNGGGNNEKQFYTDREDNVEVSNGTLKIHALHENYNYGGNTWNYTSGRITTQNKKYFKYGKVEAKIKIPRFNGAWPAFWMLGENIRDVGWPKCGEIDIMEAINNNNIVYSNLHWYQGDTKNANAYNVGDRTQWHTYTLEWDSKKMVFYCDGKEYQRYDITSSDKSEFRANQFIILNLAIGGNWPGFNIDDSAFPDRSTMEVDYVKVYQKPEPTTTKYNGPTIVVTEDAVDKFTGKWNSFFGNEQFVKTDGDFQSKDNNSDGYVINIKNVGHIAKDSQWSIQGNLENIPFIKGATYTYRCTLLSSVDKRVHVKVADGDEGEMAGRVIQLSANVPYNYQTTVTIPEDFESTVSLKFGWGKMGGDTLADNSALTVMVKDVSFITTASIPDPSYIQPTTKNGNNGNNANKVVPSKKTTPSKKAAVKLGKTKIKKVKRAKKSLKLKLKKIKGATGYQVKYSDNKKFDGFWTKKVKKPTVKLKKLDRKTRYYIKARAFKKVANTIYYGKYSKRKKAKTK